MLKINNCTKHKKYHRFLLGKKMSCSKNDKTATQNSMRKRTSIRARVDCGGDQPRFDRLVVCVAAMRVLQSRERLSL